MCCLLSRCARVQECQVRQINSIMLQLNKNEKCVFLLSAWFGPKFPCWCRSQYRRNRACQGGGAPFCMFSHDGTYCRNNVSPEYVSFLGCLAVTEFGLDYFLKIFFYLCWCFYQEYEETLSTAALLSTVFSV